MKSIKFLCFLLVAGICLSAAAAPKKTSKKKKKKNAQPVEVVDTICVDSFSYIFGKANTNGLKMYLSQRMGIDTTYIADFLKGFESKELTEADKREKARLAGTEIRNQVETQVYPQASKQVNDSTDILNKALFLNGFRDGLSGQNETVSMDSVQARVQKQMEYYHKVNMERKYGANRLAGEEFLKLNAKNDSVKTTESGLQYKILTQGTGEVPVATSKVKVNYEGKLIDGTVFDSSYARKKPTSFNCNQVIKGWTEALTMMPVGSKWEIYIPQQLGYADREQGKIPPFSTLIFTVELLEIEK